MNSEQERKAVIFITIDALRADHLKSYRYHRNTAPNLEKLTEFHVIRDYHLNKTNNLYAETSKIVKAIDRNKLR